MLIGLCGIPAGPSIKRESFKGIHGTSSFIPTKLDGLTTTTTMNSCNSEIAKHISIFTYGLFNNNVSSSEEKASNYRMINE
jgi:hypothetical protein